MENRWRFMYREPSELRGHRRITKPGNEKTGASGVGVKEANPFHNPKTRGGANKSSEVGESGCREKPLLRGTRPYRKPTQVDEERILRPAGEALSRNSAK